MKYNTHQAVLKPNARLGTALCLTGSMQDPSNVNKSHLQPLEALTPLQ